MKYDESRETRPWAGTVLLLFGLLLSLPIGSFAIYRGDLEQGLLQVALAASFVALGLAIHRRARVPVEGRDREPSTG